MLKFYLTTLFLLVLNLSTFGQEQSGQSSQDTSVSHSLTLHPNSTISDRESLPPLSLEPAYGVSPDSMTLWYLTPYRLNSWLSVPRFYPPTPASHDFLLREFPNEGVEPVNLRLQADSWMLQSRSDLLAPWKLELQSQEKYQIWRSILGSVQMGGAAYLLYLHLKKYGLK